MLVQTNGKCVDYIRSNRFFYLFNLLTATVMYSLVNATSDGGSGSEETAQPTQQRTSPSAEGIQRPCVNFGRVFQIFPFNFQRPVSAKSGDRSVVNDRSVVRLKYRQTLTTIQIVQLNIEPLLLLKHKHIRNSKPKNVRLADLCSLEHVKNSLYIFRWHQTRSWRFYFLFGARWQGVQLW